MTSPTSLDVLEYSLYLQAKGNLVCQMVRVRIILTHWPRSRQDGLQWWG